jgi:thioredoxin reductase
MTDRNNFDVIIIGGSYSGLAAGMALGRALRRVLILDNGMPCNRQTPFSHNFLTNDGKTPTEIAAAARQEVEKYETVRFQQGLAISSMKTPQGFQIQTSSGEIFRADKLVFATGIKDLMPKLAGFAECWGISVLHCPYCHGYEVRNRPTGILGNGEYGFDFSVLLSNWTKNLTLYTNGKSTLTPEQASLLEKHHIQVHEKPIKKLAHDQGQLHSICFEDGSSVACGALYAKLPFEQNCTIPEALGCELTAEGYIRVDAFQKTSVPGIYACGDNTTTMRTVANAVAMGTTAGISLNKEIVLERFAGAVGGPTTI